MSESPAFSVALGLLVGEGFETASSHSLKNVSQLRRLSSMNHFTVESFSGLSWFLVGGRPALADLARPSHGEDGGDRLDFRDCGAESATKRRDRGRRMGRATGRRRSESLSGSASAVDEQG